MIDKTGSPLIPWTAFHFKSEYLFRPGPDDNDLKQTAGPPSFGRVIPGHT